MRRLINWETTRLANVNKNNRAATTLPPYVFIVCSNDPSSRTWMKWIYLRWRSRHQIRGGHSLSSLCSSQQRKRLKKRLLQCWKMLILTISWARDHLVSPSHFPLTPPYSFVSSCPFWHRYFLKGFSKNIVPSSVEDPLISSPVSLSMKQTNCMAAPHFGHSSIPLSVGTEGLLRHFF